MMNEKIVILAESHWNMREGIRALLASAFDTVVMVADKQSLFSTLEKLRPDLAVVDLSLPAAGEVNVAKEIKLHYPDLKLIVLSVHDDQATAHEVMSAGACGYVLKRSVGTELFDAIEEIDGGKPYLSPSLKN